MQFLTEPSPWKQQYKSKYIFNALMGCLGVRERNSDNKLIKEKLACPALTGLVAFRTIKERIGKNVRLDKYAGWGVACKSGGRK